MPRYTICCRFPSDADGSHADALSATERLTASGHASLISESAAESASSYDLLMLVW
jgi:hypothetical protein